MRTLVVLAFVVGGCGGAPPGSEQGAASAPVIQYDVTTPYQLSGASPAGNDGFVYSVLPSAPLASDPWQFTFCYQSTCFTLSQPLEFIPTGEVAPSIPSNMSLTMSGSVACSSWRSTGTVQWYDATPLHWHVALNVLCSDGSVALRGDWQRL